jgi:hypothetical protein
LVLPFAALAAAAGPHRHCHRMNVLQPKIAAKIDQYDERDPDEAE